MKAYRYVLLSYFQQHIWGNIMTILVFVFFLAGNILLSQSQKTDITDGYKAWQAFYTALILFVFISAPHLKRTLKSGSNLMLPHYRRYQLYAFFTYLSIFLIIPVILTSAYHFPVLVSSSQFMFSAAAILWMIFVFGENLPVMLLLLWTLRVNFELVDLPVQLSIVPDTIKTAFFEWQQIYMISVLLISILLFILFIRYYLKLPSYVFENQLSDDSDPWLKDHDRAFKWTKRKIAQIIHRRKNEEKPVNRTIFFLVRWYQYGLFSPNNTLIIYAFSFIFLLLWLGSLGLLISDDYKWFFVSVPVAFFFTAHLNMAMLTSDFVQHRSRTASLWLWSGISSRKKYAWIVFGSFLLVVFKQYIGWLLLFAATAWWQPDLADDMVLLACILPGLYVFSGSLALFFSDKIFSSDARGWIFFNMLLTVLGLIIVSKYWTMINFSMVAVALVICLILLVMAVYTFSSSNLDFPNPS